MPSTTPTAGGRVIGAHTPAPYIVNAASSGSITVSGTTATDVPSATVTVTTAQANAVVQVIGVFDMLTASTGATAVGTCVVDGSTQTGQAIHTLTTLNGRETVAQVWPVTLSAAGSHTIKLQVALSSASGSVQVGSTHTTITATVYDW